MLSIQHNIHTHTHAHTHQTFIFIWLGFHIKSKRISRWNRTKGMQMVGWWFFVSMTLLFFLVTFSLEKPKILLLEIKCCCYRHTSKKKKPLDAWLQSRLWADKQCPLMDREGRAEEDFNLACPFKSNKSGGAISFLLKLILITSHLKNRNAFLEMLELLTWRQQTHHHSWSQSRRGQQRSELLMRNFPGAAQKRSSEQQKGAN